MSNPERLTKRQVNTMRAESMRHATCMLKRLRMSVLGEPATIQCECGKEHEVFPNDKPQLSTQQVNAIKFDVNKIYPDLQAEDFDSATDEPKTAEQIALQLAGAMTDKGMIKEVIKYHPKDAIACRDTLIELLDSKVIDIRKAG